MSIGDQIKKYRNAANLKQVELADLSEVKNGTISAMENRGSKKSEHLAQLASCFGLTVDQLMDEATDYSDHVRAFVARSLEERRNPHQARPMVQDIRAKTWPVPSGGYWPFSVAPDRVRAALLPADIQRVEAYLLSLVEAREEEAAEASAKNNGTVSNGRQ